MRSQPIFSSYLSILYMVVSTNVIRYIRYCFPIVSPQELEHNLARRAHIIDLKFRIQEEIIGRISVKMLHYIFFICTQVTFFLSISLKHPVYYCVSKTLIFCSTFLFTVYITSNSEDL